MFTSFFTAICPTYIYLRSVATWSAETSFRYITGCRHGERLRSPRKYGEQADNINLCASKVSSSADIVTSVNSSFYKTKYHLSNQKFCQSFWDSRIKNIYYAKHNIIIFKCAIPCRDQEIQRLAHCGESSIWANTLHLYPP